VQVRLEEKAGWIELTVEDNGRGLPEGAGSSSASIGMIGMRARAQQSGGEFVIGRAAAGGVRLRARVPARRHPGVEGAVSGGGLAGERGLMGMIGPMGGM
jgi:nitrate/nitrite-specific signal transduction histidine kinase